MSILFYLLTLGTGRARNRKTSRSRATLQQPVVPQRPASPLEAIPPPIPSSVNNSPVQNVPINLGRDKGPLPSFASIVSSSKFFNTGGGLIGILPVSSATSTTTTSVPLASVGLAVSSSSEATLVTCTTAVVPVARAAATIEPAKIPLTATTTSVKMPLASPKTGAKNGITEKTVSSVTAVSAVMQQAKVNHAVVATTSAGAVASFSKPITMAPSPAVSVGSTAVVSRTITRPIILGSASNKGSVRPSPAAKSRAKSATSTITKANAKVLVATASKLNSGSVVSTPFVPPKTVATAPSLVMVAALNSSSHASQRPSGLGSANVNAVAPVSLVASSKTPISSQTAVVPATAHHVLSSTPVPKVHLPAGAIVPNIVAMPSVYQNTTMSATVPAFQQSFPHRVPTPSVPVYATPTAGVYGQQHYVANANQPQASVQASQVLGKPVPTPVGAFGPGQTSAVAPQVTAAAAATASQAQGTVVPGVLVQGASGTQLFQMNVQNLDVSQFKGAYQLQGTLYQNPFGNNTMAVVNTEPKAAYANVPANQSGYANPYMFGTLVMPQATSQAAAVTTSVTTATAATATPAVTTYFNQNAAIAAAFESFVPIAPAAAPGPPRFSQTLAHLASAYNPFAPRAFVPGSNLQFPSRVMQMGGYPNNPMSAPVLSVPEYTLKYPLNALKQATYGNAVASTAPSTVAKSQVQTTVMATVPYMAFGQMGGPRVPIALNFTAPGQLANPQSAAGTAVTVCGQTSVATTVHPHYAVSGNVEAKAGSAGLGSASITVGTTVTNSFALGSSSSGALTFTSPQTHHKPAGTPLQSSTAQPMQTASCTPGATVSATNHQRIFPVASASSNPMPSVSASSTSPPEAWTARSLGLLGNSFSGSTSVVSTTASCTRPIQSVKNTGTTAEDSLKPTQSPQVQTLPHKSQAVFLTSPITSSPTLSGLSQGFFSTGNSSCSHTYKESTPKATVSPSISSSSLKRPFFSDGSSVADGSKRTKYKPKDPNYYETNPLLGLKRSCEAIEVYCESDADKSSDKESREVCEKNCDGKTRQDKKLDRASEEMSQSKDSTTATGKNPVVESLIRLVDLFEIWLPLISINLFS